MAWPIFTPRRWVGVAMSPMLHFWHRSWRAREALGVAGYVDAQAVGRALSYDDAVDSMQQWLRQSGN